MPDRGRLLRHHRRRSVRFSPIDLGWLFLVENFNTEVTPAVLLPYWFVSTYAQIVALASLPFAIPRVRETVKRAPFEAGIATLVAVGLVVQLTAINDIFYNVRHRNPSSRSSCCSPAGACSSPPPCGSGASPRWRSSSSGCRTTA